MTELSKLNLRSLMQPLLNIACLCKHFKTMGRIKRKAGVKRKLCKDANIAQEMGSNGRLQLNFLFGINKAVMLNSITYSTAV